MNKSPAALVKSSRTTIIGSRRLTIALYIIVTFFFWVSLYLYMPTLPTYVQSKSDNLALVGIVLSMYGLWQLFIRLPLGITVDWLGLRKPFIIAGLALAGLGAWSMGVADSTSGLIFGRAITGLAAGIWVPLVVAFSSLFPPREVVRATAMLTIANSVGRVLATSATGSLNEWGGYSLAFFLATGSAGLAILFMLPAPEQSRPRQRPSLEGIGRLMVRRDVLLPALLAAVSQYANWCTTFSFYPILAKQLGGTDITQSALMSMHIGVTILGNVVAAAIVNRIGARRMVCLSIGLLCAGIGIAALAPSLPVLFVAQFCVGLALGTSYPILMGLSIRHVADAERTTAMGLHQAVYALGMFSGPWLSGLLADAIGLQPMFGVTAFVCLILSLFMMSQLTSEHSLAHSEI
jgi:MFS family permease